jgi:hypothetical protein
MDPNVILPKTTVGPESLDREWHRAVATFICHAAQFEVNDARKWHQRKRGA